MSISTKIVGVTFANDDGSNRQDIINTLHVGDWVRMVDCSSPEHPEAIGIFTQDWKQCGHLNRFEAERVRFAAPNNFKEFPVYVTALTGGGDKKYGCNIEIEGITYKREPDYHVGTGKLIERVYVEFPDPHVIDVPQTDDGDDGDEDLKNMSTDDILREIDKIIPKTKQSSKQNEEIGCTTWIIVIFIISLLIYLLFNWLFK